MTPLSTAPKGRLTKTRTVATSGHVVDRHYTSSTGAAYLYRVERDLHHPERVTRATWFLLYPGRYSRQPARGRSRASEVGHVDE